MDDKKGLMLITKTSAKFILVIYKNTNVTSEVNWYFLLAEYDL